MTDSLVTSAKGKDFLKTPFSESQSLDKLPGIGKVNRDNLINGGVKNTKQLVSNFTFTI
jgi:hypothetical protein